MTVKFELKLLGCFFINMLCLEAGNPFLPLFVRSLSQSHVEKAAFLSALAISAPMVGLIIFSPVWGTLADRFGAKSMLLRASFALSLCQLLTALSSNIQSLITTRFLQGVFAGFITAMQAYALAICQKERNGLVLARLQSAKALATASGGIIGGALLSFVPFQGIYLVASMGTFMTSLIIYFQFPKDKIAFKAKKQIHRPSSHNQTIAVILLLVALAQLAKFLPQSMFAFYAELIAGQNSKLIGLLYAIPGVTILLASEFNGRLFDKLRKKADFLDNLTPCLLYFAFYGLFSAVILIIQSQTHSLGIVLLCRFLWGLTLSALLPALFTLLGELSINKGYYLGLASSVAKIGNFSGIFIGALALGYIRLEHIFLIMAFSYAIFAIASLGYSLMIGHAPITRQVSK